MLSKAWEKRKKSYDILIIGSGYGGAITAARIASAPLDPKPSVCMLERGSEWPIGSFPDSLGGVLASTRSALNPRGLYELLNYQDVSVIKGSGLGGTSLINANVAIVPDDQVFKTAGWPRTLTYDSLKPYYDRARSTLAAVPHPRAHELLKFQALEHRAVQLGKQADPLNITVNFDVNGVNPHGVEQRPCTDCGDCVTGCNVGAKNTLYMNYLPMACAAGAEIFTNTEVSWIEKLSGGGWRVHGRRLDQLFHEPFSLDALNVILAAGAINSTEILMRSEMHGLRVSPSLGSGFSGNGDFFGLAYNGDHQTNVLGHGTKHTAAPTEAGPPGPSIVGVLRYNGNARPEQRITVEDFSFPSSYILAAKALFASLRGDDTDVGDEPDERKRVAIDFDPLRQYAAHGALNHTMLYLVMGLDDARGSMVFDAPWFNPEGSMKIEWDKVGQQVVFTRMNEELRRHARSLGASYISNPTWNVFQIRHLVTAHPLGGCPMGEDYLQGAVDEFGRLFSGDGSVHEGLFVADGAVVPTALGVNPFLTISALAERIAERKVRALGGEDYPKPNLAVSMATLDPLDVLGRTEADLEKLFRRCSTLSIDAMLNQGAELKVDVPRRTILNDQYWKGFFPRGHVLNAMSSAIFTGFKKRFYKEGLRYVGVTSDTDGRIQARNSLEEITLSEPAGTLEAGDYILLRYLDIPWTGYYDIFKVINEKLLIGRVYLGEFPNGIRLFTFAMTREHSFAQMTVDEHRVLYEEGSVPTQSDLRGVWRMDVLSNNNHLGKVAYLRFDPKPDGRLESRFQLMGLFEGLVIPSFTQDHFQLNDFTSFHDEIRKIDTNLMLGLYLSAFPQEIFSLAGNQAFGVLQFEGESGQVGFRYLLTRVEDASFPTNALLKPYLDVNLPDGLGMTFDEEMAGWYFEGSHTPAEGRDGDLSIAGLVASMENDPDKTACSFRARMAIKDLNEFIDGVEHEAGITGSISFDRLRGRGPVTFVIDDRNSSFNYLRVNPVTEEAEMRYRLTFRTDTGERFRLEGRKYMQKDPAGGPGGPREVMQDYTTLFCHLYELESDGTETEAGVAYLKFRTFEDLAALGNLSDFLRSFTVLGSDDPLLQLQAKMRFLAFTAQFVQREYDPLTPEVLHLAEDVRWEKVRGAETPDFYSSRPTAELQTVLRSTPTRPLAELLNTGRTRIDFKEKRIFRDCFWKGSFASDSLLGWEERVRNGTAGPDAFKAGTFFAGGSFWKRFDRIEDDAATGKVVNYELSFLPGDPMVTEIAYPDNNRRYFQEGDRVLLLKYRNEPYRIVYDTIKVVDDNNAIGVMHLGDFPNGLEFATFVMARHNYPFEKMSVEDHHLIWSDAKAIVPSRKQLSGEWAGTLLLLEHPNSSLLNQANPTLFSFSFGKNGANWEARYKFGLCEGSPDVRWTDESVGPSNSVEIRNSLRMIDPDTLLGKSVLTESSFYLLKSLRNCLEMKPEGVSFYYVLNRTSH